MTIIIVFEILVIYKLQLICVKTNFLFKTTGDIYISLWI